MDSPREIIYRPMLESDLPAAARILNESYRVQGVPAEFSVWGLQQLVLPVFGIDLPDCIAAEVDGELAGVLLLAVDREARQSYVFAWNVRPALWRARIGLGLERRYAETHRALGLEVGWACLGQFRNVGRYRAVRFAGIRTLDGLELCAGPGHLPAAGVEIRPATLEDLAPHHASFHPHRPHWTQEWPRLRGWAGGPPWQLLVARSGGGTVGYAVWRCDILQGHVGALAFTEPAAGDCLLDHLVQAARRPLQFAFVSAADPLHRLLRERGATVTATYTEIRRDRF